jgi:hypothetical protein
MASGLSVTSYCSTSTWINHIFALYSRHGRMATEHGVCQIIALRASGAHPGSKSASRNVTDQPGPIPSLASLHPCRAHTPGDGLDLAGDVHGICSFQEAGNSGNPSRWQLTALCMLQEVAHAAQ